MTQARWIALAVVVVLVGCFFLFDLSRFFSLEALKAQRAALTEFRDAQPLLAGIAFFVTYVAVTSLSLPGAGILTLASGAIFGLVWGTVIASFASVAGATLALLTSRFLLRDWVQEHYGDRLKPVNDGIRKDGAFYLLTLRLVPAFPFFLVNLVMGLTPIRVRTFVWASQVGMLPATIVLVNAGTELAKLESIKGIFSPALLGSLALLGLFPLVARKTVEVINARRAAKVQ